MKVLITVLLFVVAVAATGKKCTSASDCGENECCATASFFLKGRCRPLVKERGSCTAADATNGVYLKKCPCASGLVCKPKRIIKSKYAAVKKKCRSTSDCDENECCTFKQFFRKGTCKPLSKENDRCSRIDIDGEYFKVCPCESGLVCKETEKMDVGINSICVKENEVTTGDGGEVTIEAE